MDVKVVSSVNIIVDGVHLLPIPLSLHGRSLPPSRIALGPWDYLLPPHESVGADGRTGVRNQIFSASWVYQKSLPMLHHYSVHFL